MHKITPNDIATKYLQQEGWKLKHLNVHLTLVLSINNI